MLRKKIISNTAIQLLGRAVSTLLSFITTYLIIRLSGTSLYGDMTKILAILAISYAALDFGINAHVVRSYAKASTVATKKLLSNLLFLRIILALIIIIITNLFITYLPGGSTSGYTDEVKLIYRFASLAILFQGIHASANSLFQHQLKYHKAVIASTLGAFTLFGITLYALLTQPSLGILMLANTAGFFITAIVSIYLIKSWLTLEVSFLSAFTILKSSLIIGLVLILSILASKTDAIILGIFRSTQELGEYGLAYKIFDFALILPVFAMNAIYPIFLQKQADKQVIKSMLKSTSKYLFILGILIAFIFYNTAHFVTLIKPGLTHTINALKILSLSLPLFYLTAPLMWLLVTYKQELALLKIYFIAAIFNLGANLYLVPHYGSIASAVLTIFTESIILIGLYLIAKNKKYV